MSGTLNNPATIAPLLPKRRNSARQGLVLQRGLFTATAAWACILLAIAPILVTLLAAFTKNWNLGPFGGGVTLEWVVGSLDEFLPGLSISTQVATITVIANLVIGVPLAWTLARTTLPGLGFVRWLTNLPLVVPGIAVGLALVAFYPHLQRSGLLLIAGHILATMPFMVAAVAPALADRELIELERTASTLGARYVRRTWTITIPHIRTALISGALMVLTISFGEFNLSYFIVNPAQPTLPVSLFGAFIYGQTSNGAALTLWYCLTVIPLAVGLQILGAFSVKRSGK